jgi:hypothetical protein
LARLKFQTFAGQSKKDRSNLWGNIFDADNHSRKVANMAAFSVRLSFDIRLYYQVCQWFSTARQGLPFSSLFVQQGERGRFANIDLTFHHSYLAGGTGTAQARVR